jgi:hypothetical protein
MYQSFLTNRLIAQPPDALLETDGLYILQVLILRFISHHDNFEIMIHSISEIAFACVPREHLPAPCFLSHTAQTWKSRLLRLT